MKQDKMLTDRINLRLTPTDRLTISRTMKLGSASLSDVIRSAVHTAFLLIQMMRDDGIRLVLRNDKQRTQEDLDVTLISAERQSVDVEARQVFLSESQQACRDILQIRLTARTAEELETLVQVGFARNRTAVVRRALELHYQIVSKIKIEGARFGTLSTSGEFTSLPVLDLGYSENREVGSPRSKGNLVQLLFDQLVSRQIEEGKKLIVRNEEALGRVSAGDFIAPQLFYVLSGWAEYSALAAEVAQRLDSNYKREAFPTLPLASLCFIETGMANFAHYQNRDTDVEKHFLWVQENASRFGAGADVLGTMHLVRARSGKRCALYAEALNSTRKAIYWYGKAALPGMVAVAKVTEGWLLMQMGGLREATKSWEIGYECLKDSEDWTVLGNIMFAKARRLCHAGREPEAVSTMQESIDFYSRCDPSHRNLSRALLELANQQLRMSWKQRSIISDEELREKAADNIARAEQLLKSTPRDYRNWGRKLLSQVNQELCVKRPLAANMRRLAIEAYNFAERYDDLLIMARARLKQAEIERRVAASSGCADPVSARLHALEYASHAAEIVSGLQDNRLNARVHTFLGNLFLDEGPFRDMDRATAEWDVAVQAMAKHEDEDYVVDEIRTLGRKLSSPAVGLAQATTIFLVTENLAFGQPLDDTIRAAEHAIIQSMAEWLGSNANPHRIGGLLDISSQKVADHLDRKRQRYIVTEPQDGDGVLFRITTGLAFTQPLKETLRAVEVAIVRAACVRYECRVSTVSDMLHTGHDRVCEYVSGIKLELERSGYSSER
jgi:tetratricopeptide (TPR) repeat protein